MGDVRDTATGAATLVAQIAEVVNDAQAEAAKPDSEFGGNVGAILAAAKKIEKKAAWNNAHIDAVVEGLQWSAGTVLTLTEAETDVSGIVDYLALCMRRALRTAYSNKQ
ncbi:hypothetical protein ONE63_000084 [Megalurothrips usitatus]|uniref:Uncharacterized protein n=1 Tax=Megalurothrips usitatus TaxID=439358 RepID=A0AAV7Y178_9NEOP|nr:hypothetical protein ONE63_000084 [Megalurothrips usitatus]